MHGDETVSTSISLWNNASRSLSYLIVFEVVQNTDSKGKKAFSCPQGCRQMPSGVHPMEPAVCAGGVAMFRLWGHLSYSGVAPSTAPARHPAPDQARATQARATCGSRSAPGSPLRHPHLTCSREQKPPLQTSGGNSEPGQQEWGGGNKRDFGAGPRAVQVTADGTWDVGHGADWGPRQRPPVGKGRPLNDPGHWFKHQERAHTSQT